MRERHKMSQTAAILRAKLAGTVFLVDFISLIFKTQQTAEQRCWIIAS